MLNHFFQQLIKANLQLKENVSELEASNGLLRATTIRLEAEVASLRVEATLLRGNLSLLQSEDTRLSYNTSTCSLGLEATASRAFGLEVGLICVAIWLAIEHLARPVWVRYRKEPFPVDR
jgi:hypothetical protein